MLFGSAYKPKGLFGGFAPSDKPRTDPFPMEETMVLPVAQSMGQRMPEKKQGINWLGVLADTLAGAAGREGPYMASVRAKQEREMQAQQMQADREAKFADWERQKRWERDNPAPANNDTVNDYQFIMQTSGPAAAQQYLESRYDPVVNIPLGDGRTYVGPRSGAPSAIGGASPSAPAKPVGKLTPISGGAGGNPSGGFPVTGNKLDRVTVQSESAGNPNAVSPKGAMGLWQVMPATARDPGFGITPWNGAPNDLNRVGQQYRQKMESRYGGDLAKMWAAYNWGPGNVDKAIAKHGPNWLAHAPAETRNYVARNLRAVRGGK